MMPKKRTNISKNSTDEINETPKNLVPIGVSNRHVHLKQEDLDILFGDGYALTIKKPLSQPGQFACEEVVEIQVGERYLKKVRVLGPIRKRTQIEISASDARKLRCVAPVRKSGDLDGSAPVILVGPKGKVDLSEGMIIANRHIHLSPAESEKFNIKDKDIISVRVRGEKAGIFQKVQCRVKDTYAFEMHIDTDDAAAFMLNTGDKLEMII